MPPQISRIVFAPDNDTQRRALFAALDSLGDKHGVPRAWWPAARPGYWGNQYIMTYSIGDVSNVDVEFIATKISQNTDYSYQQVLDRTTSVNHATGTIKEQFIQMWQFMASTEQRRAQWLFTDLPDWYTYVEPVEFVEPEEPPEGWPISTPLQWVEIEEPV